MRVYKDFETEFKFYESSEFIDQLKAPRVEDREDSSDSGSSDFTGTRTFDEALRLMVRGDDERYHQIN